MLRYFLLKMHSNSTTTFLIKKKEKKRKALLQFRKIRNRYTSLFFFQQINFVLLEQ